MSEDFEQDEGFEPRIESATIDDLAELTEMVMELMELEQDFVPDRNRQEHGLRLILENPNRGRIFVLRTKHQIIGMVNLLFTISTAIGSFVVILEDFIIHPDHRGQGYGSMLFEHVKEFSKKRQFGRITLLTDKVSTESQEFFRHHGFEHSEMIPMRLILNTEEGS